MNDTREYVTRGGRKGNGETGRLTVALTKDAADWLDAGVTLIASSEGRQSIVVVLEPGVAMDLAALIDRLAAQAAMQESRAARRQ
jgi:hypothetical protein